VYLHHLINQATAATGMYVLLLISASGTHEFAHVPQWSSHGSNA
jgi:hypothetical protein